MNLNEIERDALTDCQRQLVDKCFGIELTLRMIYYREVFLDDNGELTTDVYSGLSGKSPKNRTASIRDWVDNQVSVERVYKTPNGVVTGGRICCAFNGPNIFVTVDSGWENKIIGRWYPDTFELSLSAEAINILMEYFS